MKEVFDDILVLVLFYGIMWFIFGVLWLRVIKPIVDPTLTRIRNARNKALGGIFDCILNFLFSPVKVTVFSTILIYAWVLGL